MRGNDNVSICLFLGSLTLLVRPRNSLTKVDAVALVVERRLADSETAKTMSRKDLLDLLGEQQSTQQALNTLKNYRQNTTSPSRFLLSRR